MTTRTIKDPNDVIDYRFNWGMWWLSTGDTIKTSAWEVDDELTKVQDSKTTTTTTVRISGGVAGQTHEIKNHIVTENGEEGDHTLALVMQHK